MLKILVTTAVAAAFALGCAHSTQEISYSDTNTQARIQDGDRKIADAYEAQWDVLAYDELQESAQHLEKAKKADSTGKDLRGVTDELAKFDEHYARALSLAQTRMPKVQGILDVRKKAITSGIRQAPENSKKLSRLDSDLRDLSNDKTINVKEYSDLQIQYLRLAALMGKQSSLTGAQRMIDTAINNKAKRYAPRALNQAQLDVKTAEAMIASNLDKPEAYDPYVKKANNSAATLSAIVTEQRRVNYNLDESAAKKIVEQSGMVAQLNQELMQTTSELSASQSEIQQREQELQTSKEQLQSSQQQLNEKDAQLSEAEKERGFQAALASAQREFSKDEADVYRQGDKILIRLKSVGFDSGKATVPDKSKQLLDKVASVTSRLSPTAVVVEGHTDSVGSEKVNNELSQKRADAVVDYLSTEGISKDIMKSEGYGFQKPLTSNKTKEGRAQNRRVDVWITPESPIAAPAAPSTKE